MLAEAEARNRRGAEMAEKSLLGMAGHSRLHSSHSACP